MTTVYSAAPLTASNTSVGVAITDKLVAAGIDVDTLLQPWPGAVIFPVLQPWTGVVFPGALCPIFGGPINPSVPGIYLTASPGARFRFRLTRHSNAGPTPFGVAQGLLFGDERTVEVSNAPIGRVTNADLVNAEMIECRAGSLTLSIVQ